MVSIRVLLNRWVIAGSIIFACILFFIFTLFVVFLRSGSVAEIPSTAVIEVIPAPTATDGFLIATAVTTLANQSEFVSGTPAGEITVGAYVKVVGTGGDGLRLRDEPGLNGKVRLLGDETEVFNVNEGPLDMDGYIWWYLVGTYDETRQGWAVADFLSIVENP
jgi:hypothetical protein